jgi:DNA-directed RNA polymerase specialized sigma24 family protein
MQATTNVQGRMDSLTAYEREVLLLTRLAGLAQAAIGDRVRWARRVAP